MKEESLNITRFDQFFEALTRTVGEEAAHRALDVYLSEQGAKVRDSRGKDQEKPRHLIQYVRKHNRSVGCVVALQDDDGQIKLGWSLCHRSRTGQDTFIKQKARALAFARAQAGRIPWPPDHSRLQIGYWDDHIPQTINRPLQKLHDRAVRYFTRKQA